MSWPGPDVYAVQYKDGADSYTLLRTHDTEDDMRADFLRMSATSDKDEIVRGVLGFFHSYPDGRKKFVVRKVLYYRGP